MDRFSTLDEAILRANDTEYGLTAGIFSEDMNEVNYFFDDIEFGVVYANRRGGGATTGAWPGAQLHGLEGKRSNGQGGSQWSLLPPQLHEGTGTDHSEAMIPHESITFQLMRRFYPRVQCSAT